MDLLLLPCKRINYFESTILAYYEQNRKSRMNSWLPILLFSFLFILISEYGIEKPKIGECYISDLAVHPDYRGIGIGSHLLMWAEYSDSKMALYDFKTMI